VSNIIGASFVPLICEPAGIVISPAVPTIFSTLANEYDGYNSLTPNKYSLVGVIFLANA